MSAPIEHPTDALHDALDGRLNEQDRADLQAHLDPCADCRREFAILSALKQAVGVRVRAESPVPEGFESRLRAALDVEDGRDAAVVDAGAPPRRRSWRWAGWAAAIATTIALTLVWGEWRAAPAAPSEVAANFQRYVAGDFVFDDTIPNVGALERRLSAASLGFPIRVFDFGMMAYRLEGGGVNRVTGRPSAAFAYAGPDSLRLLCQMYAGTVTALPAPAERRTNDGIDFLIYHEGAVTVVFWQEGEVVCTLAANDAEAAIRLAFAKAVAA